MKLALILTSKHQKVLDDCYKTLLPSIEGKDIRIFMISMFASSPPHPQVTDIRSIEYIPNHYFNRVIKEIGNGGSEYVGIINDDIVFEKDWLDNVLENLKIYDCVSPGYVQSSNPETFIRMVEQTKNETGVRDRFFGSCYVFRSSVFEKIGKFDENVVGGYDIDWWWRMKMAGLSCVTLKKVLIMHYNGLTNRKIDDGEPELARLRSKVFKGEFVKKFGVEEYKKMVIAMRGVRKEYVFE